MTNDTSLDIGVKIMEQKRFTLRMDGNLYNEIAAMAQQNRRSVAKEIELAVSLYLHTEKMNELKVKTAMGVLTAEQSIEELKKLSKISDISDSIENPDK